MRLPTFSFIRLPALLSLLFILPLTGCGEDKKTAVLWTDRPEFALYADRFNAAQEEFKIETRYFPSVAERLTAAEGGKGEEKKPDILAGSWLKSAATRRLFRPLDVFFKEGDLDQTAFYPSLLEPGRIDGKQYLLPVSFNLPALIFSRDHSPLLSNPFTIDLGELERLRRGVNLGDAGGYSRMGFSPAWDDEFLFQTAVLYDAAFREAGSPPLSWDEAALTRALERVRRWSRETNGGFQGEDDFSFKYFYDPPAKLIAAGRILFSYMKSSEFFILPQEQRANLDFRWLAGENRIPLAEDSVYYGISRRPAAKKAAAAFTRWFFREDTQRLLLEVSKQYRVNETLFGIGSGFSGMRTVTEQVFPQFYPTLLGHMPPEAFLAPPNILPRDWTALKERVILPYLREEARREGPPARSLERRLTDWLRLNRGL